MTFGDSGPHIRSGPSGRYIKNIMTDSHCDVRQRVKYLKFTDPIVLGYESEEPDLLLSQVGIELVAALEDLRHSRQQKLLYQSAACSA